MTADIFPGGMHIKHRVLPHRPIALLFATTIAFLNAPGSANAAGGRVNEPKAVTNQALSDLRDVGGTNAGLSISSNGRFLLYNLRQGDAKRNQYRNQWILLDLQDGVSRMLVEDAGTPLLSYGDDLPPVDDYNQGIQAFSPVWSADGSKAVFVKKDDAGIRLHWVDISTGKTRPVAGLPEGKVTSLSADSGAAIVTIEVSGAQARQKVAEWQAQGQMFTGNEFAPVRGLPRFEAPTEQQVLKLDLLSGHIEAKPPESDACAAFPGWPRNQDLSMMFGGCRPWRPGESLAVALNLTVRQRDSTLYVTSDGRLKPVTPAFDSISDLEASPGNDLYFTASNGRSASNLYWLNGRQELRALTKNNQTVLRGCQYHFAKQPFAVCLSETLNTPREIVKVDLRKGVVSPLTNLNPEYLALARPVTRELNWTAPTGDLLSGTITYPLNYDAGKRYPVVVTSYPHAGFSRGSNGDEFPIPVLAAQGFVVIDVNAPAHYHWTALDIPYEQFAQGYAEPLRAVEQYLRKLDSESVIDLRRVGICGLSGGGNFSAYAISHSTLFAAAIFNWHEADYLARITLGSQRDREFHARRGLGEDDTKNWQAYSLGFRAKTVNAAALMNVADAEFYQALGSYDALKGNKKPVEMWIFPDAHHVKWLPSQRLTVYNRNVDWFKFWLQDRRSEGPETVDQYARWARLRADSCAQSTSSDSPTYCSF